MAATVTDYFCSAMHWPFPRALKRNLTTLQIAQIASGTFLTNLYLLTRLNPSLVAKGFVSNGVRPWVDGPGGRTDLLSYATARAATNDPAICLQTVGAEIALHVNTSYMFVSIGIFVLYAPEAYSE